MSSCVPGVNGRRSLGDEVGGLEAGIAVVGVLERGVAALVDDPRASSVPICSSFSLPVPVVPVRIEPNTSPEVSTSRCESR